MDNLALSLILAGLAVCCILIEGLGARQNVILLLADDLGWGDVEMTDTEMRTPNLRALQARSTFLSNSYVMPTCAPTRAAILTGRYPHTFGMQSHDIEGWKIDYMNSSVTLMPTYFKKLGYKTHMIGKWHLGFCDWTLTPTNRGFDTFYGFFAGAQGYFNHSGGNPDAFDFWDLNPAGGVQKLVKKAKGSYSTDLHTERAQSIIRAASAGSDPFLLYMSYQSVHAPWEAKAEHEKLHCGHVKDPARRTHCAMGAALDDSVGRILRTLEQENLLDSTTVVFMSDNGGPVNGGSSNWPYRGKKATVWEGGIRSYTMVSSPSLKQHQGNTYDGFVHAVDWLPTFLDLAGGDPRGLGLDGQSAWKELQTNKRLNGSRKGFVVAMDDQNDRYSVRQGRLKLTHGIPGAKAYNGWYSWGPALTQHDLTFGRGKGVISTDAKIVLDYPEGWHLYDAESDPQETRDVYEEMKDQPFVAQMRGMIDAEKARIADRWGRTIKTSMCGKELAKRAGGHVPGFCDVRRDRREVHRCPRR